MTLALLALTGAILALTGAIVLVAWWHLIPRWPQTLTEDEIRENIAPTVAALLIMADENADPPVEDWTP